MRGALLIPAAGLLGIATLGLALILGRLEADGAATWRDRVGVVVILSALWGGLCWWGSR